MNISGDFKETGAKWIHGTMSCTCTQHSSPLYGSGKPTEQAADLYSEHSQTSSPPPHS